MFQMMGVFAEFERSMIQERVRAGLKRAKVMAKRPIEAPGGLLAKRRSSPARTAASAAPLRLRTPGKALILLRTALTPQSGCRTFRT